MHFHSSRIEPQCHSINVILVITPTGSRPCNECTWRRQIICEARTAPDSTLQDPSFAASFTMCTLTMKITVGHRAFPAFIFAPVATHRAYQPRRFSRRRRCSPEVGGYLWWQCRYALRWYQNRYRGNATERRLTDSSISLSRFFLYSTAVRTLWLDFLLGIPGHPCLSEMTI